MLFYIISITQFGQTSMERMKRYAKLDSESLCYIQLEEYVDQELKIVNRVEVGSHLLTPVFVFCFVSLQSYCTSSYT